MLSTKYSLQKLHFQEQFYKKSILVVTIRGKNTLLMWKVAEQLSTLWLSENKLCTGAETQWCTHLQIFCINSLPQKRSRGPRNPPNLHFQQGSALNTTTRMCAADWGRSEAQPTIPCWIRPWWGAADTEGTSQWNPPSLPALTAALQASEDHWNKQQRKKSVETASRLI